MTRSADCPLCGMPVCCEAFMFHMLMFHLTHGAGHGAGRIRCVCNRSWSFDWSFEGSDLSSHIVAEGGWERHIHDVLMGGRDGSEKD